MRTERPFSDHSRVFSDVLFQDFVLGAISWLMGDKSSICPSAKVGAHAEVGLTLMAMGKLGESDHGRELVRNYGTAVERNVAWLIEAAIVTEDGVCWDNSSWDTAACVRGLLHLVHSKSWVLVLNDELRLGTLETCLEAVTWLINRYNKSALGESNSILNPSEVAQIGITLAECYSFGISSQIENRSQSNLNKVIGRLCNELLFLRSEEIATRVIVPEGSPLPIWWGDYFGSGDVIHFLNEVRKLVNYNRVDLDSHTRELLDDSLIRCLFLIEHTQSDGLWGTYIDTANILWAYVKVTEHSPNSKGFEPVGEGSPRTIFRTVRWFCDPTQLNDDGSVLHTAFLTTFFVMAAAEIIELWSLRSETLGTIYDEVAMIPDGFLSRHELEAFRNRLELNTMHRKLRMQIDDNTRVRRTYTRRVWRLKRWIFTIILFVITTLFWLAWLLFSQAISFSGKYDELITSGAFLVPVCATLIGVVWAVQDDEA